MAAVIGAVASIVQFLDVAARLSSFLSCLCSDVRNVPQRFDQLRIDLDQQLHVTREIRAQDLPTFISMVTLPMFDNFLLEYIAIADELRKTLDELVVPDTDGLFIRSWHGLGSVRKKEDILHLCDRLEQRKSTLSLWLSAANLKLSSNINLTTNRIEANAGETLRYAKMIEDNSRRIIINVEQMLPQLQEITRIIAGSSKKIDIMTREFQQIKDQSAIFFQQTGSKISKLDHIDEVSPQILSNTVLILEHLQQLCCRLSESGTSIRDGHVETEKTAKSLHQLSFELERPVQSHTNNILNLATTSISIVDRNSSLNLQNEGHLASLQQAQRLRDLHVASAKITSGEIEIDTQHEGYARCKCRSIKNTSYWQPFSILHFMRTVHTPHFSYCPRYARSDQETDLVMRLVPPSWLLSRTIHFGIQWKNFWSTGDLSIAPIIIGTNRLVDPDISPAFLAIQNTREELKEAGFNCSSIYIPKLKGILEDLFENQKASPFDMDRDGSTLLYEVLWIYDRHLTCGVKSDPGYEYVPLIQFLLDKGSNPNVISNPKKPTSWDRAGDIGGTAFDLFAKQLRTPSGPSNVSRVSDRISLTIFEKLAGERSEFSKPFNSTAMIHPVYQCEVFNREVKEYTVFEEQVELCDLGFLAQVILQRHENKVRQLMTKATLSDINHASSINGLAPIHFAILWPEALKMLIGRGANINVEDHYRRRPIHLAVALGLTSSVDCLLGADCALFTPPDGRSLLENALNLTGFERRHILNALIAALADRHGRLIERARSLLPSNIFLGFNIIEGRKKERQVPCIMEVLLSRGFTVPEALKLDSKSVYSVADMHGRIQMGNDVANALWSAGFEDINEPNEDGLTPLLQNWFCANFPMIAWFVHKDVSLSSKHRDASLNGLHLYAIRIQYPGTNFSFDPEAVPTDERYMAQIQKEVGIPHDGCTCLCSPNGCSPIKFLCKESDQSGSRRDLFRTWLKKVKPEPRLLQQYVLEFTRRLLFDFLGCKHTCCVLGQQGNIETVEHRKNYTSNPRKYEIMRRVSVFRTDRLPQPCSFATSAEEAEGQESILESYISKYNEIPRPETLLPEERPFHDVHWVSERYVVERTGEEHSLVIRSTV